MSSPIWRKNRNRSFDLHTALIDDKLDEVWIASHKSRFIEHKYTTFSSWLKDRKTDKFIIFDTTNLFTV